MSFQDGNTTGMRGFLAFLLCFLGVDDADRFSPLLLFSRGFAILDGWVVVVFAAAVSFMSTSLLAGGKGVSSVVLLSFSAALVPVPISPSYG